MKRVIKFRVFDKALKRVIYRHLEKYDNEHPEIEVNQYTGLKDKNGKEIYEGDIVEKNKTFAEVKYCPKNAAFYIQAREFDFYFGWDISQKNISVVGNIYENSDLLK